MTTRRDNMTDFFGTPIYINSADDSLNENEPESMTTRLKEVLKTLAPLEKVSTLLKNASKSLSGTGYENIQTKISQLQQEVDGQIQEITMKLTQKTDQSNTNPVQNNSIQNNQQRFVPTAGQISGKEPLPSDTSM